MDQESLDKLAEITAKEPLALTPGDILFLKARSAYLTPDQLALYAEAMAEEAAEAADEKTAKSAKK
jgi:hypothetical protein